MKRVWLFLGILIGAAFFLLGAIQISKTIAYQNSDFFQFWLGARFFWEGKDPYNSLQWMQSHQQIGTDRIASPAFLYPLPLAFLLLPLGILPLKTAFILWSFLSQTLILLSIVLLLKTQNFSRTKHLILPILIANIIFRPTTTTLLGGQISALYLFIATIAGVLWRQKKWFWGGAALALLTLKPSIGFPLLLIISPWLLLHKKIAALKGIASTGVLLFLIGFIKDPHWIPKYLHILTTKLDKEFGNSPTIWGGAAMACQFDRQCTAWAGFILLILFLSINIWLLHKWQNAPTLLIFGHLISIGILSTLYLWPYDHLLLAISIVSTMALLLEQGIHYLKVSFIFLGISLASVIIRVAAILSGLEKETIYGLLPLLVWGITTWMITRQKYLSDDVNPSRAQP